MTARLVARCLEPGCGYAYSNADPVRTWGGAISHWIKRDHGHDFQITREDDDEQAH